MFGSTLLKCTHVDLVKQPKSTKDFNVIYLWVKDNLGRSALPQGTDPKKTDTLACAASNSRSKGNKTTVILQKNMKYPDSFIQSKLLLGLTKICIKAHLTGRLMKTSRTEISFQN